MINDISAHYKLIYPYHAKSAPGSGAALKIGLRTRTSWCKDWPERTSKPPAVWSAKKINVKRRWLSLKCPALLTCILDSDHSALLSQDFLIFALSENERSTKLLNHSTKSCEEASKKYTTGGRVLQHSWIFNWKLQWFAPHGHPYLWFLSETYPSEKHPVFFGVLVNLVN